MKIKLKTMLFLLIGFLFIGCNNTENIQDIQNKISNKLLETGTHVDKVSFNSKCELELHTHGDLTWHISLNDILPIEAQLNAGVDPMIHIYCKNSTGRCIKESSKYTGNNVRKDMVYGIRSSEQAKAVVNDFNKLMAICKEEN